MPKPTIKQLVAATMITTWLSLAGCTDASPPRTEVPITIVHDFDAIIRPAEGTPAPPSMSPEEIEATINQAAAYGIGIQGIDTAQNCNFDTLVDLLALYGLRVEYSSGRVMGEDFRTVVEQFTNQVNSEPLSIEEFMIAFNSGQVQPGDILLYYFYEPLGMEIGHSAMVKLVYGQLTIDSNLGEYGRAVGSPVNFGRWTAEAAFGGMQVTVFVDIHRPNPRSQTPDS